VKKKISKSPGVVLPAIKKAKTPKPVVLIQPNQAEILVGNSSVMSGLGIWSQCEG
jgi:hypothetical protein